jgi:hypothetical protein
VDEFFKQKGRHLRLTFGKVIPYSRFDKSQHYIQWTEMVRNRVYAMQS